MGIRAGHLDGRLGFQRNVPGPTLEATVGDVLEIHFTKHLPEPTSGPLDPFVTLLEVHKLMYFMQEAGQPLKLKYVAAPYGPYAENLRHVLSKVEGHLLSGYGDGGEDPDKQLSPVPGAVEDAQRFLVDHPDAKRRFERVSTLVDGFETPFGLELLATVHWVMTRGGANADEEVVKAVYAWNERKKQFSPRQIGLAIAVLTEHGWLNH